MQKKDFIKNVERTGRTLPAPLHVPNLRDGAISSSITHDRVAEIQEAFRLFDTNNQGHIAVSDLRTLLLSLSGGLFENEQTEQLLKLADVEENGTVDFDEFFTIMSRSSTSQTGNTDVHQHNMYNSLRMYEPAEYHSLFSMWDRERTGWVSKKKFLELFTSQGEGLSEYEVAEMCASSLMMNKAGDMVNYRHFVKRVLSSSEVGSFGSPVRSHKKPAK